VRLKWSELFEASPEGPRYAPACERWHGKDVELRGWLSPAHDGSRDILLVERPGECPDCSPVAAVALPGFTKGDGAVTLRGRLSYGFAVDAGGKASFLRLEDARVAVTKIK
jgi:hypothetical protein